MPNEVQSLCSFDSIEGYLQWSGWVVVFLDGNYFTILVHSFCEGLKVGGIKGQSLPQGTKNSWSGPRGFLRSTL